LISSRKAKGKNRIGLSSTPYIFNVNLIEKWGVYDVVIPIPEDVYVKDAAEEFGLTMPQCDGAGASGGCAMKTIHGVFDDPDQTFLTATHKANSYFLSCVAYAVSDGAAKTCVEEELY
jgi:ferredoxin